MFRQKMNPQPFWTCKQTAQLLLLLSVSVMDQPRPTTAPRWKSLAKMMFAIYNKMIVVMRTMAIATVTPTLRARMLQMTGLDLMLQRASAHAIHRHHELVPAEAPPPTRELLQLRCDHTHLTGKNAFTGYGGPWGKARRCVICQFRLKWHPETRTWEEWPDTVTRPSRASSSRSQQPSSAPINRPRTTASQPQRTSQPVHRTWQDIFDNPTAKDLEPQEGNSMSLYEEADARISAPRVLDSDEDGMDAYEGDWWGEDGNYDPDL